MSAAREIPAESLADLDAEIANAERCLTLARFSGADQAGHQRRDLAAMPAVDPARGRRTARRSCAALRAHLWDCCQSSCSAGLFGGGPGPLPAQALGQWE